MQVTLLDSVKKKCAFVREAVEMTGIQNAHVVCSRAETGAEFEFREVRTQLAGIELFSLLTTR